MSDNNLHKIFANTACVSTEMMMDYLDGKLSEKEKNKVEVHIASCEMCRDEFEGLSLLEDKSKLAAIIIELDQKVDDRLNTGGKKIPLFRNFYRIAAAIVILITSAWFISLYVDSSVSNMDESVVSQAMEEKTEADDGFVLDEEPKVEEQQEAIIEREQEKKENNKDLNSKSITQKETDLAGTKEELKTAITEKSDELGKRELMEEEIPVEEYSASINEKLLVEKDKTKASGNAQDEKKVVSKEVTEDQLDDLREEENEEIVADYAVAEDKKLDRKATRGDNRRSRLFKGKESKKKSEAPVMSNTLATDNFDQAMAKYNERDYKQAVELFKKSLDVHSNSDEVHFYLAKSYANLNDTENALVNYNKVIAMVESPYYEDALWNKAHLLMELNKRKSAINSLNQIKAGKGIYSGRAEKIIDSLNTTISAEENK
jgi:hypothetical protein